MEEDTDNAAVDEGRFGEVDDDRLAGGEDGVELGLEGGQGGQVVLTAQHDHRYIGQVFDDDLADLRHAPLRRRHLRLYAGTRRRLLFCLPRPRRGQSRRDLVKTKRTADLANFHLRLPCEPTSVPRARERVRDWCRQARIRGDVVADIQLAVTEAAANAVRHAACVDFEIQGWMRRATLIVSVWDQGRGRGEPEPGAGLGTRIIRVLSDSADFEDTQPGTRVTMRFRTQPAARETSQS